MRLTTTGTISGLTNTQGFFDAATGATKNVEISGNDIDSSVDAAYFYFDNITNNVYELSEQVMQLQHIQLYSLVTSNPSTRRNN